MLVLASEPQRPGPSTPPSQRGKLLQSTPIGRGPVPQTGGTPDGIATTKGNAHEGNRASPVAVSGRPGTGSNENRPADTDDRTDRHGPVRPGRPSGMDVKGSNGHPSMGDTGRSDRCGPVATGKSPASKQHANLPGDGHGGTMRPDTTGPTGRPQEAIRRRGLPIGDDREIDRSGGPGSTAGPTGRSGKRGKDLTNGRGKMFTQGDNGGTDRSGSVTTGESPGRGRSKNITNGGSGGDVESEALQGIMFVFGDSPEEDSTSDQEANAKKEHQEDEWSDSEMSQASGDTVILNGRNQSTDTSSKASVNGKGSTKVPTVALPTGRSDRTEKEPVEWESARQEAREIRRELKEVNNQLEKKLEKAKLVEAAVEDSLTSVEAIVREMARETNQKMETMSRMQTEVKREKDWIVEEGRRLQLILTDPDTRKSPQTIRLEASGLRETTPVRDRSTLDNRFSPVCRSGQLSPVQPHSTPGPLGTIDTNRRGGGVYRRKTTPPVYDPSVPYDDYRKRYEGIATANGWSEEEKARYLAYGLPPAGTQALIHIHPKQAGAYLAMTAVLIRMYGDGDRMKEYQEFLSGRKQLETESLADFAQVLTSVARRAYPSVEEGIRDGVVWRRFLAGLRDRELADQIRRSSPTTMAQTMDLAIEILKKEAEERTQRILAISGAPREDEPPRRTPPGSTDPNRLTGLRGPARSWAEATGRQERPVGRTPVTSYSWNPGKRSGAHMRERQKRIAQREATFLFRSAPPGRAFVLAGNARRSGQVARPPVGPHRGARR